MHLHRIVALTTVTAAALAACGGGEEPQQRAAPQAAGDGRATAAQAANPGSVAHSAPSTERLVETGSKQRLMAQLSTLPLAPLATEAFGSDKLDGQLSAVAGGHLQQGGPLEGGMVQRGKRLVQIATTGKAVDATLLGRLQALGFEATSRSGATIVGWLPDRSLDAVARQGDVGSVRAMPRPQTHAGAFMNQADFAMWADTVRNTYRVTGEGQCVGIISNSFNLQSGLNAGILAGELPGPGNPNGRTQAIDFVEAAVVAPGQRLDEGRAMAELVHDIAPRARIAFRPANDAAPATLAAQMQALADSGCNIVVDDIGAPPNLVPFFQNDPAAVRVNELAARGVHYFTSAGNFGINNYFEQPYTTANQSLVGGGYETFDFDPDPQVDNPVYFMTPQLGRASWGMQVVIQWDEAWRSLGGAGAATRLEAYLLDQNGRAIFGRANTVGNDPVISFALNNIPSGTYPALSLIIVKPNDGRPRPGRIKAYIRLTDGVADETIPMLAPSIVGHKNAEGAISVGATSWFNTPRGATLWNSAYGGTQGPRGTIAFVGVPASPILSYADAPSVIINRFGNLFSTNSSLGGAAVLFADNGGRLAEPVVPRKPDIVAPDGVENSFFGALNVDLGRNLFFGTSASSPNAAAVAALLLQASGNRMTPADMKRTMTETAEDMDDPYDRDLNADPADPAFARGFDFASGFGMLRADRALQRVMSDVGTQAPQVVGNCRLANGDWRLNVTNPNGFGVRTYFQVSGSDFRFDDEPAFSRTSRERMVAPSVEPLTVRKPSAGRTVTVRATWYAADGSASGTAQLSTDGSGLPSCP